jgi:2-iminobutanoate/2-iminopropanoate deaminase
LGGEIKWPKLATRLRLRPQSTTSMSPAIRQRSHAVVANGFVFVSGQIPVRPGGAPTEVAGDTMQEQTRQCLRNVETILKSAGSSLDRVVKITVLLARPDLYREMNEAYAEFFTGAKPARSMVRFGADIPGVLVAIDAIALA